MKKNQQIMLTCSGVMLVLQSIAYYLVWNAGYSLIFTRRMFLIVLLTLAYLLLTVRRIDSKDSESMTGFCIAYIVALFTLFPLIGTLIVLNYLLILIELAVIILAIDVAILDRREGNDSKKYN